MTHPLPLGFWLKHFQGVFSIQHLFVSIWLQKTTKDPRKWVGEAGLQPHSPEATGKREDPQCIQCVGKPQHRCILPCSDLAVTCIMADEFTGGEMWTHPSALRIHSDQFAQITFGRVLCCMWHHSSSECVLGLPLIQRTRRPLDERKSFILIELFLKPHKMALSMMSENSEKPLQTSIYPQNSLSVPASHFACVLLRANWSAASVLVWPGQAVRSKPIIFE